jgi:hypothetical protein
MVFAQLTDDQFGQARAVQCQHGVSSPSDLIAEAEWLWSAESNNIPRLCFSSPERRISPKEKWGCVALLRNPQREIPQQLLDRWSKRVSEEPNYSTNDRRLVDSRGILQIRWPEQVDGSGAVPLDLLLEHRMIPRLPIPVWKQLPVLGTSKRVKGGANISIATGGVGFVRFKIKKSWDF